MKKLIFAALMLAAVGIAAAVAPMFATASSCDAGSVDRVRFSGPNGETYRREICAVSGVVTFTDWIGGVLNETRAATAQEIVAYNRQVSNDNVSAIPARLLAAVDTLDLWADQAQVVSDNWATSTTAYKLNMTGELFDHMAVFFANQADLIRWQIR